MGNTTLYEALFMLGKFATWKISTTNSFLGMTHSYFSSNPTLAISEIMKTSIFNSLIASAYFLAHWILVCLVARTLQIRSFYI